MEIREIFSGLPFNKERRVHEFTYNDAAMTLKLFSDQGTEGQAPQATFQEGSTIILSKYPPGTILRESIYYSPDAERGGFIQYWFFVVGSYDAKKRQLSLFRSLSRNGEREVYSLQDASIIESKLNITDEKKNEVNFEIGGDEDSILDRCLRPGIIIKGRKTIKAEVMQMGVKQKLKVKDESKHSVRELKPIQQEV